MTSSLPRCYRSLLSELRAASRQGCKLNRSLVAHLRASITRALLSERKEELIRDFNNAAHFLASEREYKVLLHRYNPLHDLTTQERVKATARRVGLDMPVVSGAQQ